MLFCCWKSIEIPARHLLTEIQSVASVSRHFLKRNNLMTKINICIASSDCFGFNSSTLKFIPKNIFSVAKIQLERCSRTYKTWLMTAAAFHDICSVRLQNDLVKVKSSEHSYFFMALWFCITVLKTKPQYNYPVNQAARKGIFH